MATQTTALPDGSTLTKPAYTDSADIAVINSNMDKIVTNINAENQALSHYYDTNGVLKTLNGIDVRTITEAGRYYCVGCTNLPGGTGYGYLDVYVYNANYRRLLFHEASYDAMYTTRLQNGTWQSWERLATNALDTTSIHINRGNYGSFTFSGLNAINDSAIFKHGLLIWGTGASNENIGMSIIFVNTDGTVMIKNVTGTGRTFTGQVKSDGTLTITPNAVVYGGLKLIWLT